jgi:hypothetical protein
VDDDEGAGALGEEPVPELVRPLEGDEVGLRVVDGALPLDADPDLVPCFGAVLLAVVPPTAVGAPGLAGGT